MDRAACIFGCSGQRLTAEERRFFADAKPLGFILFARNSGPPGQILRLTEELRETAGHQILILTDHEGGRVQRFTGAGWRSWLPPLEQCETVRAPDRMRALWLRYRIIASELAAAGINVNCVPCCDVAADATHPFLRNRCYSADPVFVAAASRTVASACLDGGVLPVVKHIPGHGRPVADSHRELPFTDAGHAELADADFLPFRKLADLPLGMIAHVLYRSIDGDHPSSQSKRVISTVRNEIGFDGLVMTDDLSMSALNGAAGERARLCLAAGCDVILHCNGDIAEMETVFEAAGALKADAAKRAERALRKLPDRADGDCGMFAEEFRGICGRSGIAWN